MSRYVGSSGNLQHTQIAEKALGHKLPAAAVVHHVDGNGKNNSNENLVVCPSESYHKLLHIRQEALDKTGNPVLRKCMYCKQYDGPLRMSKVKNKSETYYHKACHTAFAVERYWIRKEFP